MRWLRVLGVAMVAVVSMATAAGCGDDSSSEAAAGPSSASGPTTTTTAPDISKIIPLNGDLAEIVFALGLGDKVVATDVSATFPPEAAALPKVGYQRTLSAEGILSFSPTIVLATTDAGPPPVIDQIKTSVPTVIVEPDHTLAGPGAKIRAVANALGVTDRGETLAKSVEEAIAAAKEDGDAASTKPRAVMLYLRGAGTQLIMGEGTGIDAMLEAAGAHDAAQEAGVKGTVPITPEALIAAAPDVLIVTTTGLESVGGIDGLLAIPGIAQTPAGQNRRVLDYDDQLLLGGGPRTGDALKQLVADLHS